MRCIGRCLCCTRLATRSLSRQRTPNLRTGAAPQSFVSLDDADHLLNSQGDAAYAAGLIAAWAKRYCLLLPFKRGGVDTRSGLCQWALCESVTVQATLPSTLKQGATLVSDEPVGGGR
jgi:putative redox protein